MRKEIDLTSGIEIFPVVATGRRWPALRENTDAEGYFGMFPE